MTSLGRAASVAVFVSWRGGVCRDSLRVHRRRLLCRGHAATQRPGSGTAGAKTTRDARYVRARCERDVAGRRICARRWRRACHRACASRDRGRDDLTGCSSLSRAGRGLVDMARGARRSGRRRGRPIRDIALPVRGAFSILAARRRSRTTRRPALTASSTSDDKP